MPETNQRFKKAEAHSHPSFAAAHRAATKLKKELKITGDEDTDLHRIRIRARSNGEFVLVRYERLIQKKSEQAPTAQVSETPKVKKTARKSPKK